MAVLILNVTPINVPAPGVGYIAGELPDGIVTLDNVPGRAFVDLLRRADHAWLRREVSRDDGMYLFAGLSLGVEYDLIGVDMTNVWDDVIVSRVQPYAPPQITTASLAFTAGMPSTVAMASQYGTGPMAWTADTVPPGLVLAGTGAWSGTPTAPGSYSLTVTVTDVYGESSSRSYTAVVS